MRGAFLPSFEAGQKKVVARRLRNLPAIHKVTEKEKEKKKNAASLG